MERYLKNDAVLLDVRTASEFNSQHIEGSINIPVQSIDQRMEELDKDKPIIAYCAMGGRSAIAAAKLKSKGYVVLNAGGIKTVKKQMNN